MIYWGYVNIPRNVSEPEKSPAVISEKEIEDLETAGELAFGVLVIWGIYEIMKWGIAAAMTPVTGGTSLAGAACLP